MPLRLEYDSDPTKRNKGESRISSTVIGKGATSIVKLAVHSQTKQIVAAAKIVNLYRHSQYFEREVQALSKLNHPHIVKLLHTETHPEEGYGVLFLEYLPFPTLYEHVRSVGQLPENVGIHVLSQIVDGFKHMQNLGFSHGDFKPENVVYDSSTGTLKIIDFGLSLNSNGETQFQGSPMYMAPEVHLCQPYDPFLADVWSIGICFYEILTGDTPFHKCVDNDDLLDQLLYEDPFYSIPPYLSPNTIHLLQRMLVCDPSERITVDGLLEVLSKILKYGES